MVKRGVMKLTERKLTRKLRKHRASVHGTLAERRDRLVRALLRVAEPDNPFIAWGIDDHSSVQFDDATDDIEDNEQSDESSEEEESATEEDAQDEPEPTQQERAGQNAQTENENSEGEQEEENAENDGAPPQHIEVQVVVNERIELEDENEIRPAPSPTATLAINTTSTTTVQAQSTSTATTTSNHAPRTSVRSSSSTGDASQENDPFLHYFRKNPHMLEYYVSRIHEVQKESAPPKDTQRAKKRPAAKSARKDDRPRSLDQSSVSTTRERYAQLIASLEKDAPKTTSQAKPARPPVRRASASTQGSRVTNETRSSARSAKTSSTNSKTSAQSRKEPAPKKRRREIEKLHIWSDESESDGSITTSRRNRSAQDSSTNKESAAQIKCAKLLKDWGLRFSGEEKTEDPDDFLERLGDCKDGASGSDKEFLKALPCIFSKKAARWYRTIKDDLLGWKDFTRAFKRRFIGQYDKADLADDLKRRTQGRYEKISAYISSIRYIVSRFREPPKDERVVEIAYRNLFPPYRRSMRGLIVDTLEDIEKYGREYERERDLDRRWQPPPSADKMHVPGAAYIEPRTRKERVAEIKSDEEDDFVKAEVAETVGDTPSKKSKKKKKKSVSAKKSESESESRSAPRRKAKGVAAAKQTAPSASQRPPAPNEFYAPSGPPPQARNGFGGRRPAYNSSANRNAGYNSDSPVYNNQYQGRGTSWLSPRSNWANGSAQPSSRFQQRGGPRSRSVPPQGGRQPSGSRSDEYSGACYTCQGTGHRASQCPRMECWYCRRSGHPARECPERKAAGPAFQNCQLCDRPGHVAKACPTLNPNNGKLGNGQAGGQEI